MESVKITIDSSDFCEPQVRLKRLPKLPTSINNSVLKASELRIGNFAHSDNVIVTLDGRSIFDAWSGCKSYKPIGLTEYWLLKFGFENDAYANFSKMIGDYSYLVISFRDYACTQIRETISIADHDVSIKCEYVHQLQNLYFALSGQELEMK